jgi:acetylornithine deacetylase
MGLARVTAEENEAAVVESIDPARVATDLGRLVAVPSITGHERAAAELVASLAGRLGLPASVAEHDLAALRASPGHPGEEAPRDELVGATAVLPGAPGAPRLCLNGHVDVVGPGRAPWSRDPFGGEISGGFVHGRARWT